LDIIIVGKHIKFLTIREAIRDIIDCLLTLGKITHF
jgi:hypothetical protein